MYQAAEMGLYEARKQIEVESGMSYEEFVVKKVR